MRRLTLILTLVIGVLAPGCTWRTGDTQHTLVLGMGVVTTHATGDSQAEATRTSAAGVLLRPDMLLIGAWTQHRLRIAPDADAWLAAIEDEDDGYRAFGHASRAARHAGGPSLSPRSCVCLCSMCESGSGCAR